MAAHGVDDQVDARCFRVVEHAMRPPRIEDPAFARRHVDGRATTVKRTVGWVTIGTCTRTRSVQ